MSFDTKILEFHQELEQLAKFAQGQKAKDVLLSLPILTNQETLELCWNDITWMKDMHTVFGSMPMRPVYDIDPLLKLIEKGHICDIEEAIQIKDVLLLLEDIEQYIKELYKHKASYPLLDTYPFTDVSFLTKEMHRIFDVDHTIKDHASETLNKIRKRLAVVDQRYTLSVQQALKTYESFLNEHVIATRNDALCLAVNEAYKHRVKGSIMDMSQSKQTVFIEPHTSKTIREEKLQLLQEEKHEIFVILTALTKHILSDLHILRKSIETLLTYDCIQAKALYASSIQGVRPVISEEKINLIEARHPQLKTSAIPIHITLEKQKQGLFITGPNTGGKTVSLKTVGLLHLLGQAGLFIPAKESSNIMLFEHIFADIGDQQSIENSLSTFSSHLTKHIQFLKQTSDKTLLLIDEIGSGTDPQEGVALAKALLNAYLQKKAMMIVTTHYQALKEYALKQNLELASVAFDEDTLSPLYHIIMGIAGQSHAFDIAKRLGVPQDVLTTALTMYESSQSDAEKLLRALESKEQMLTEKEKAVNHLKKSIEAEYMTFEKDKISFETYKSSAIEKAIEQKTKQLDEKINEVKHMLDTLKNTESSLPLTSKIKGHLKSLNKKSETSNASFEIGDRVFIKTFDQIGVITSKKHDVYEVQVGHFNMKFNNYELEKTQKPIEVKATSSVKKQASRPSNTYIYELDLRGFRFEEVKPALEKAIDQALLSNQETLRIIHGFGTGAVRKAVYQFIKGHPNIKSHRFGQEGEGLNGVTVITLK